MKIFFVCFRLVVVRELLVVRDAVLAEGVGVLDFEANIDALEPIDTVFVTQDNDRAEVEALCHERGIRYIVQPKPSLSAIFGIDLPEMHPKHIKASFEMAFRDAPMPPPRTPQMGPLSAVGLSGASSSSKQQQVHHYYYVLCSLLFLHIVM